MEHEVGEIVELIHDNKTFKLKVIEQNGCNSCFFCNCNRSIPNTLCSRHEYNLADYNCSRIFRKDKKGIIYKQIK